MGKDDIMVAPPSGVATASAVRILGGLTCAARAVSVSEIPASAAYRVALAA